MAWVEIRSAIFLIACVDGFFGLIFWLAWRHSSQQALAGAVIFFAVGAIALHQWLSHFDRGRTARFAPVALEYLHLAGGAFISLWQVLYWIQHAAAAQDQIPLIVGSIALTVFITLLIVSRKRRSIPNGDG
jgi:hypothetical protein